ncbi:MAG: dCTP deaminase [Dehalococcoidia bacterium]
MVLSDRTIKEQLQAGKIRIEPFDPSDVQPASVDVHLDRKILVFRNWHRPYIDIREDTSGLTELVEFAEDEPFILHPGEFVLGSTLEHIELPDDLVARLEGKSSLGRIGLLIHSTAGYVDPGWRGHLTLELSNVANLPITLYYKMKIGQISFLQLTTPVDNPYGAKGLGSKYQGQTAPTASKIHREFGPVADHPPTG